MNEKKPIPKKKKLIAEHKMIVVGGIVAAVALAGIISGIVLFTVEIKKKGGTLIIDLDFFLNSFDPLYNPDDISFSSNAIVWDQIIEGLFEYDQSHADVRIVPNLAKDLGTWSSDGLNYTIPLRKGVTFHDGTPFNATAVKWNFDRIHWFIDNKPREDNWVWYYMYLLEGKPIINETKVIDEYTVRFVLNKPYVPLRAILTVWPSLILSPSSTPEDDYVDKFTGKLIGTGPFILESYEMDPVYALYGNVTVKANIDYWGGKPLISEVNFLHFSSEDALEKMVSGELSFTRWNGNKTMLEIYENSTGTTVVTKMYPGVFYLGMNNNLFPLEMRKAMSYAFNYSDYIKKWSDYAQIDILRSKSPLPEGMLYHYGDLNGADYDIQLARQTLIDANWEGTAGLVADENVSTANPWESLVDEGTPLETYNISIVGGWDDHLFYANLIAKYFKQIGVKIELNNLTGDEWWDKMRFGELDFFLAGWGAAFNDPVEILDPLYSAYSDYNHINFNDTQVQEWLEQGLIETNEKARKQIYYNIQKCLVEELYPVIWIFSTVNRYILRSDLKGIPLEGPFFRIFFKDAYFV